MHIYGPVPSRRLGYSLGVDILPFKTCSLDCIYCQLGKTERKTVRRKKHFDADTLLSQIKGVIASGEAIDHITFSGSGEPTLNALIGKLIREIKKNTSIPVAVLTNSTLISHKSVRSDLSRADVVVPSLDAATQAIFELINRPHASLKISHVIEGLKLFRREFGGKLWLEILLVKGVNDSRFHLNKLKEVISEIHPDKIHLNTVVRPPSEKSAQSLGPEEMEKIRKFFGNKAEVVAEFDKVQHTPASRNLSDAILSMVRRRPVTLSDMSLSLGKQKKELTEYCDHLLNEGKIRIVDHKGKKFYEST
jgi:wyosine [tRNA(Phe)-imidazoG37] synthetase (radical SAM superfamily)